MRDALLSIGDILLDPSEFYRKFKEKLPSAFLAVVILVLTVVVEKCLIIYLKSLINGTVVSKITVGFGGSVSSLRISPYIFALFPVIGLPVYLLIIASFYMAFNLVASQKLFFKEIFTLVTYSNMVKILEALVRIILAFIKKFELSFSFAYFLRHGFFHKFLSRLDLFTIWANVLIIYGLVELTGTNKKKGWLFGILIFILYTMVFALVVK